MEAKSVVYGKGNGRMFQIDEATYTNTALKNVSLGERGPETVEERGQVPADEG